MKNFGDLDSSNFVQWRGTMVTNSPISQRFSPSGEQLEHSKLANEL